MRSDLCMKMIQFKDGLRLQKQLNFIIEIDKIKDILRKTKLIHNNRYENDAEHSWSICVMAMLLEEYSNFKVDILKVMKMLLIHDVVEIDVGDTFLYARTRQNVKVEEQETATRVFSILEADQQQEMMSLWLEFEAKKTPEAKFATVFDRLEPILQNYLNEGGSWKELEITYEKVIAFNEHIAEGSAEIWCFVLAMLDDAVEKGYLKKVGE